MSERRAEDLVSLLAACGIEDRYDAALAWCKEAGADNVDDIIDAEFEGHFADALNMKPIKRKMLLTALQQRKVSQNPPAGTGTRKPAPSIYDSAWQPAVAPRDSDLSAHCLDKQKLADRLCHGGNRKVPPNQWGMTVGQFNAFLSMCRGNRAKWAELAAITDYGKAPGVVTGHQINEAFVKPFTRGTGCSVALLVNPEQPLDSDVMLSHTWCEDILEFQDAVNDRAEDDGAGDNLVIWCCIFANYQPEDECGPKLDEQLELDPFGCVIRSAKLRYMCLVVTSTQDPYERLWCVYELHVAIEVKEERARDGLLSEDFIKVEFSQAACDLYRKRILSWSSAEALAAGLSNEQWQERQNWGPEFAYWQSTLDCQQAECSFPKDREMIRKRVEDGCGWLELNRRVAEFRRPPVAMGEGALPTFLESTLAVFHEFTGHDNGRVRQEVLTAVLDQLAGPGSGTVLLNEFLDGRHSDLADEVDTIVVKDFLCWLAAARGAEPA